MNDTSSSPSELESVTTPAKEDIPMIVIPYDEDEEVVSPHQALIVLHQPSSPEVHLSMRLGAMLRRYNWDETWMGVLPARVGHNRSLDLAISAYLEPQKLNSVVNLIAGMDSMRLYTEAVDLVQTTMNEPAFWTSEDIQLTVGVLSAYESIKGASMAYMFVHRQGLTTLLSRSIKITDAVRAMVYDETAGAYIFAIVQGIPSPFDSQYWLGIDPIMRQTPTRAVFNLRKIAYRLSVRLPRLIIMVRRLRQGLTDLRAVLDATALALELYGAKDEQSESELLHGVVVTSFGPRKSTNIVSVGLKFGSFAEFEAGIYYWQETVFLNRLCARLQKLFPRQMALDLDAINTENSRFGKNLLMSWESAFDEESFGTTRGAAGATICSIAMIAIWGVLTDVSEFNGQPSERMRKKVLDKIQILMARVTNKVTAKQMDEMADLFAGGPILGLLPAILGGPS